MKKVEKELILDLLFAEACKLHEHLDYVIGCDDVGEISLYTKKLKLVDDLMKKLQNKPKKEVDHQFICDL